MCECNDYPPEFFTTAAPIARKNHNCCECLRIIRKGEKYFTASGLWDGEFSHYKTCATCDALIKEQKIKCYCFSLLCEELREGDYEGVDDFFTRRRINFDRIQFERLFRDFS